MKMSNRLLLIAFAVLVVMMLAVLIVLRPITDEILQGTVRQSSLYIETAIHRLPV